MLRQNLFLVLAVALLLSVSFAQRKEIRNPREYNAYMGALNQIGVNQKAIALEGFLTQYPNSVMRQDALELLMAAYEQAGNSAKVKETAQRILQTQPNNLKALALLTYSARAAAEAGQSPPQNLQEAGQYGKQGLQALQTAQKPEGMSDAQWQKLKAQVSVIFNGAVGQAALQQEDYPTAQQFLKAAIATDPNNLRNLYPLALSFLEANPPNPEGFWYIARTVNLTSQAPAQQQAISTYGRSRYVKYHGSDEGWNELIEGAQGRQMPPAGFTVKTPSELATALVQQKTVSDMSFDEIQFILMVGNQNAAGEVWNGLRDKPTKFVAQVIDSKPTKLTLAATAADIEAGRADVEVSLVAALPEKLLPQIGAMVPVQATPNSYSVNPFLISMSDGILGTMQSQQPSAAPTPSKHPNADKPQSKKTLNGREIARMVRPSVVVLLFDNGTVLGTGFFVANDVIATNFHVIKTSYEGYARWNGGTFPVRVAAISADRDLALLRVYGATGIPLALGSSSSVEVGDKIYAVGNPEGLEATFSEGNVSNFHGRGSTGTIQISAPISHGSSGGPVLNDRGQVIGIASAMLSEGQNLNFAIPVDALKALLPSR